AGDRPAAFALVLYYRGSAYYASSCKDPDFVEIPTMHLVQWEAMRWLKARGISRYDIGAQHFGPRWDYIASPKERSIAAFKRGFGGETTRVDLVEKFYSADVLAEVGAERVQRLVADRQTPVASN
ncbi:MAG: GNAT family N-acetyltransferase, partial [Phycisphaerae bacterium]|nr:GNAT family N-acetyltransferase [Phycisphaerae bacterium]